MAREKEMYRENLARIIEVFPDKEILSQADVARFTGRGTTYVRNRLGVYAPGITKVNLARVMCEVGGRR
jgi:hypothetical protein